MADTTTTNIVLTKPEIAGSIDTWGAKWNANADVLDDEIARRVKKAGDALTGPLGVAPGSTAAPGLYVTGDADTGINSSAPNTINVVTGGVNRVEVSDTSVTIKTTTTTITGAAVLNGTLAVDGNVRLGDSSTDTLTVHPNAVAWQAATTTHAGSHILTGNLQVNGNTTLGDAAADTLTVNPSAVAWPNNPTHGGNHTFSGNVSVQGNTTIGNAAADTLTVHPNAVAWQNAVTHSNNHTFSGNVSIEGNTTLGNASTDTLTIHPSAVTWQQTITTHANNHTFSGDVSIEGNTTLGNASTDSVTLNGSLSVAAGVAGTARAALGTVADPGANGVMVRTAANATTARTIAVSGTGLSITNETGVAGNPTIASNATSANTGGAIVARDANGDFSARIVSAALSGNASTATNLSTNRDNWNTNGTISAVVGQLAWKNYGNGHTIFDASQSTSPNGGSVNNTNAQIAWTGTYPTLMGWNGSNTYGVRVDSARVADSAGNGGVTSVNGRTGAVSVSENIVTATGGNPPYYAARAFARWNSAGTLALAANVSSISGTNGAYTMNFSTAMPDTAFLAVAMGSSSGATTPVMAAPSTFTTTSFSLVVRQSTNGVQSAVDFNMVAIFR